MKNFLNIKFHSIFVYLNECIDTLWDVYGYIVPCVVVAIVFSSCQLRPALAATSINPEKLAQAIYRAEGGSNTRHPYGILKHYKHTTPKQACLNTIRHAQRDYKGEPSGFISFLASRYAPLNVKNDPTNLNANWKKNVEAIYGTL